MFNYNHLFYFYTTARLNGVTKAANTLRIAQPSLSMQLKALEGQLGIELFEKVGRNLQLTSQGKRVYEICRTMFEAAEHLEHYLKTSSVEPRRCRIGVAPEIERPFVGVVLSGLLAKSPDPAPFISLSSGQHKDLLAQLAAGELDVVVTNNRVHSPNLHVLARLKMPVVAVVGSRMLKKIKTPKDALPKILKNIHLPLVLPSDKLGLRLESDVFLQKSKLQNSVVFESDILSVIARAAAEGVGIAFLPEKYILRELREKSLHVLNQGKPLWETNLFVVGRKQKTIDPMVEKIVEVFNEQLT